MTAQDVQNLVAMYYRSLKGGLIEHHEIPLLYTAAENCKKWIEQQTQKLPIENGQAHPEEQPGEPATTKGKNG